MRERAIAFVAELKRRRVFRVLVAYVLVGFTVAEGADIFFPALGFPEWSVRLVVVLITLGLPVALGLAWVFDVVPDPGAVADEVRRAEGTASAPRAASAAIDAAARWTLIQDLFAQALDAPEDERESLLVAAARSDPSVADEVRSLLSAHRDAGPLDALQDRVLASVGGSAPSVEGLEGETVLHYEVLERLGGGGMGVVYMARDTRLDRIVTLKFLSAHLLRSDEAKQRFLIEAQAAAALDHPNLCTIHEIGETPGGLLYIAMAYYDGESLHRRIGRTRIPVDDALDIAAQMCRGLAAAAANDIVHRDIKPGNVMLTSDGTVKIVDFGLAKRRDGSITQTGALMGTVSYMSPEQTRGELVDQRTDVWSVGVVLYEILTGKRPFRGGSDQAIIHAILNTDPTPAGTVAPDLSPGVCGILERALRKEPALRYPDASSLLADIERLLADPESRSVGEASPTLPAEGERRLVTVLACTISGFETILDTLEPEVADQRLAMLRGSVQRTVEDYGGVLNDFTEDRLVALFGVPVTHEDDALRAVRAALELRIERSADDDVELRLALGSGQVVIRATEDPEHPYRVGGDVAREVSRLAAEAEAGEVLVAGELARAVSPFMEIDARPGLEFSGATGPVPVVTILSESEVDSRIDASLPGTLTRFVGRGDELSLLVRTLENTNASGGRLASIVGDAGVGKSRLLHEFRTMLADDSIRYVQGRCQAHRSLTPFLPFIECVKAMLGLNRVSPEQAHDQVVVRTIALSSDLEIYVPLLLHLLAIDSEEHPIPDYLVGEDLRAALAEALVSFFTVGSRGQPLVLLLEDWHWSDTGSDDVLNQLAEMIPSYPLLVVLTSRPQADDYRPAPRGQVHLDLAPLETTSAVEVMRAALGARLPADLAERIGEKTGGNPFFIEELCHTLLEDGTIVVEGGTARVEGSLERVAIPDTVQAVLKTRLDRLDPEAREVLRSASVIGRHFGLQLLSRVVPSASRLQSALDKLRSSGLIQRTGLVPEPTYAFKHALTLDVTYDSLLERQRRERHRLVGEAMEELYAGRIDEFCDRLARHFAGAEDWNRAIGYGLAAAERAASLWRLDEAVSALERTRDWIERCGDPDQVRDRRLVELLLEEERHLETLGRRERQQVAIDRILELLPPEPSGERARTLVRQGELSTLLGDDVSATAALTEAIEVAEACAAHEERILAVRALGHRYWRHGMYEDAVGPLTEVVEYDRLGAPGTLLLRDLINLGRVLRELGRWDEAIAIGEEAQAMARGSGNQVDQIYSANYLGHLYRAMGRPEDALAAFERGSAIGRAAHLPVRLTFNLLAQAALYMDLAQIDESRAMYDEAIETARRAARADNLAAGLVLYADALMTLGQASEASPLYEEAVAILDTLAQDRVLADSLGKLAKAREHAGESSAADTWARARQLKHTLGDDVGVLQATEHEARLRDHDPALMRRLQSSALDLAVRLEDHAAEARIRNSLAITAWKSGDLAEARREYENAADLLRASDRSDGLGVVLNGLGAVLTRLGEHTAAEAVLREALEANRAFEQADREADTLSALGAVARAEDDPARAYDWYQLCLDLRRGTGDRTGEGWAMYRLAELSEAAGTSERAGVFTIEALTIAREIGDEALIKACSELAVADGIRLPAARTSTN
jgi:serine/threonine protein kinase/tetratricopeptide (TPR) repeat protein